MGSLEVSRQPLVNPWTGQRKRSRIRTRSLSPPTSISSISGQFRAAVTSGRVDHGHLLVILCTNVDRILDILCRWLRQLCQGGRRIDPLNGLDSVSETRHVKPLPDLLRDLPTIESTFLPGQPDILKATDLAVEPHCRSGQRPVRGHLRQSTFQGRASFEGSRRRRGHLSVGLSMGGPATKLDPRRPSGAWIQNAAEDAMKGQVGGRARPVEDVQHERPDGQGGSQNTQNVADIVRALRELGDNLDISMRNHKEPAVQAIFGGHAQPWSSIDLVKVIKQDILINVVGASLEFVLFLWRL